MIPAIGLGGEKQLAFDRPESFGSPVAMCGRTLPGLLGSGEKTVRMVLVARSRSWMDQGLGLMRCGVYAGWRVKGARSQAMDLPSGEKIGAKSLPVEAAGKVSWLVERLKSAR